MSKKVFLSSKRDLIITPLIEAFLLASAAWGVSMMPAEWAPSWAEKLILFYCLQCFLTFILLFLIRKFFPFREGVFTLQQHGWEIYKWNLYGFLCITNLNLLYVNQLIPIPMRSLFYQLLGAKIGSGVFALAGKINDPHFVEIGDNVIIGDEAYLSPHAISIVGNQQVMIVKRIVIESGAIIGAHSTLSPGVVVKSGAIVGASLNLPMNKVVETSPKKA